VARRISPPDFRYVWLAPARREGPAAIGVTTAVTVAAGALVWGGHPHPIQTGVLVAVAAIAAGVLTAGRRVVRGRRVREVAMAVVPWGVLVDPDTEPRVLRWAGIRGIKVDVIHTLWGGTPSEVASVVTVDTGHELLVGRAGGAVGLEALTVNLDAYAEEAAHPVALDLEGMTAAGSGATEPVVADLLDRARDLCTSGQGAAQLGLPPGGYRTLSSAAAGPETLALLHSVLAAPPVTMGETPNPPAQPAIPADVRPLASVVAVLLDARELLPDLLRLVSAPHPVVAAVAKAAALRLGAPQSRAGAVDEVASFLFEEDLEILARWAFR
jgi:hypothetical protein